MNEHPANQRPWGMNLNSYLLLLHLSQLAGYIAPGLGFIMPIVMWISNRNLYPEVDRHGKEVVNWIITLFIYCIIAFVLFFLLVGIPILIALGIIGVLFPIIGAIRANDGEFWAYPFTIRFIK
ncbi:MAG TPA: hypothetical protein DCE41_32055 [Cytophagales bacterium]|nr:hypothetical protein [Cytophagales bacterium]HAA22241.1 hypothetical protein [Cytophagales bacterium]HAP63281.1 hypothetical protein [Cytophagales bacterium]